MVITTKGQKGNVRARLYTCVQQRYHTPHNLLLYMCHTQLGSFYYDACAVYTPSCICTAFA